MCNRVVQKGRGIVKPTERLTVLMKGPGAYFELPFEAVFGGPAKSESRSYWIKREGAEPVIVPDVEGFGERSKATGEQNWQDVPAGTALEGLLLPLEVSKKTGEPYRLLKVVTQPATPEQLERLGNDRAPVVLRQEISVEWQASEPKPNEKSGPPAAPAKPEEGQGSFGF